MGRAYPYSFCRGRDSRGEKMLRSCKRKSWAPQHKNWKQATHQIFMNPSALQIEVLPTSVERNAPSSTGVSYQVVRLNRTTVRSGRRSNLNHILLLRFCYNNIIVCCSSWNCKVRAKSSLIVEWNWRLLWPAESCWRESSKAQYQSRPRVKWWLSPASFCNIKARRWSSDVLTVERGRADWNI